MLAIQEDTVSTVSSVGKQLQPDPPVTSATVGLPIGRSLQPPTLLTVLTQTSYLDVRSSAASRCR
jgi:hypothetical protein